jgi:hypothetical protein
MARARYRPPRTMPSDQTRAVRALREDLREHGGDSDEHGAGQCEAEARGRRPGDAGSGGQHHEAGREPQHEAGQQAESDAGSEGCGRRDGARPYELDASLFLLGPRRADDAERGHHPDGRGDERTHAPEREPARVAEVERRSEHRAHRRVARRAGRGRAVRSCPRYEVVVLRDRQREQHREAEHPPEVEHAAPPEREAERRAETAHASAFSGTRVS